MIVNMYDISYDSHSYNIALYKYNHTVRIIQINIILFPIIVYNNTIVYYIKLYFNVS